MALHLSSPMPAIFVGHGNPMNVIQRNQWTESWTSLGAALPRPTAILVISAHWYISETKVTAMDRPRTIHDFTGFPQELYALRYPAPGDPLLATKVRDLLASIPVTPDDQWGLDHGAWSVLYHMFPEADIPVVQLSINRNQPPAVHYAIGKLLSPLREEGILILGSGNLVHNIQAYNWDKPDADVFDWALLFEKKIREALHAGDDETIIDYFSIGSEARLSVPTPDHYLPLLYVLGSRKKDELLRFPVEGFDGGSMSMTAIQFS